MKMREPSSVDMGAGWREREWEGIQFLFLKTVHNLTHDSEVPLFLQFPTFS